MRSGSLATAGHAPLLGKVKTWVDLAPLITNWSNMFDTGNGSSSHDDETTHVGMVYNTYSWWHRGRFIIVLPTSFHVMMMMMMMMMKKKKNSDQFFVSSRSISGAIIMFTELDIEILKLKLSHHLSSSFIPYISQYVLVTWSPIAKCGTNIVVRILHSQISRFVAMFAILATSTICE